MKINIGDVIQLKYGALKSFDGEQIVNKHHLLVVTDIIDNQIYTCPTSSADKVNNKYPYNVMLQDAKYANFNKENTHVKTDKHIVVSINDIYKKIGTLSLTDINNILRMRYSIPNNRFIKIEMIGE